MPSARGSQRCAWPLPPTRWDARRTPGYRPRSRGPASSATASPLGDPLVRRAEVFVPLHEHLAARLIGCRRRDMEDGPGYCKQRRQSRAVRGALLQHWVDDDLSGFRADVAEVSVEDPMMRWTERDAIPDLVCTPRCRDRVDVRTFDEVGIQLTHRAQPLVRLGHVPAEVRLPRESRSRASGSLCGGLIVGLLKQARSGNNIRHVGKCNQARFLHLSKHPHAFRKQDLDPFPCYVTQLCPAP